MTTRYWMFSDAWVGGEVQDDVEEALETLDSYAQRINMDGRPTFTVWVGPLPADWDENLTVRQEQADLRLELDHEQHRAAVTWIPDGTHVIELQPGAPFTVIDPFSEAVEVAGSRAVASLEAARRALAEYVVTGRKPEGVAWS